MIYNNATTSRDLQISIDDTWLDGAHQLENLYGGEQAELKGKRIDTTMSPLSLAVYAVH